jgi:hypothetical protein
VPKRERSGMTKKNLIFVKAVTRTGANVWLGNTKCLEKEALSGHVIQFLIKTLTSKFGK